MQPDGTGSRPLNGQPATQRAAGRPTNSRPLKAPSSAPGRAGARSRAAVRWVGMAVRSDTSRGPPDEGRCLPALVAASTFDRKN
ncbi:hypothetical protein STXM2123_2304 [Streptomyces sp. F-3]|nr:hypothetical protein STXM2123_2304 [Streptomyces sp. F-3]